MWVKICGIVDENSAMACVNAGADAIGFMFAQSPRRIDPALAARIGKIVTSKIQKIGVFVDEKVDLINTVVKTCALDFVQLHGSETQHEIARISVPVIKAVRVGGPEDLENLSLFKPFAFLLDSKVSGKLGGSGHPFDWSLMASLPTQNTKIIVAGGLNSENVSRATKNKNIFGVDVSSGVETQSHKDPKKIAEFVRAAKSGGHPS
jgi:phosphoribosylanthranilate isomerase